MTEHQSTRRLMVLTKVEKGQSKNSPHSDHAHQKTTESDNAYQTEIKDGAGGEN